MTYQINSAPEMGEKISILAGKLSVPDYPILPYVEGDGTGRDIWRASQRVFDAAVRQAYGDKRKIKWMEVLAGEKAYNKLGSWLPDETVQAFKDFLVGIKGPLTTPISGGFRSLECSPSCRPGPVRLPAPGTVCYRCSFTCQAPGICGYGHLPREHRGYLYRD